MRYKARLIAKGFTQTAGVDYQDVFSPVTKSETFRFLLGYVAANDYELEQVDIMTAFLNGELHEEIYVEIPPLPTTLVDQFVSNRSDGKAWRLYRAIYGLKNLLKSGMRP